jgi:tRNA uridine 5-carboxymethylaminomethyl modification enzyme
LRIDNADARLSGFGHELGLLPEADYLEFIAKEGRLSAVRSFFEKTKIAPEGTARITLKEFLRRPEIGFENVLKYGPIPETLSREEIRRIEAEVKYEGYLKKQGTEISRILKMDGLKIPVGFDISQVHGLSREAVEKVNLNNPKTIGEMKRIPGLTPSDFMNVYIHLAVKTKKMKSPKNVPRGSFDVSPKGRDE